MPRIIKVLDRILPCPFCGSEGGSPRLYSIKSQNGWCVLHDQCAAMGPLFGSRNEAVEAWNTRARPDAVLKSESESGSSAAPCSGWWKLQVPLNATAMNVFMRTLWEAAKRPVRVAVIVWPVGDNGPPTLETLHSDFGIVHMVTLHSEKDAETIGKVVGIYQNADLCHGEQPKTSTP